MAKLQDAQTLARLGRELPAEVTGRAEGTAAAVRKPPRASLFSRVFSGIGGAINGAMYVIPVLPMLGSAMHWVSDRRLVKKAPKISASLQHAGNVSKLVDETVGNVPDAVAGIFGASHGVTNAVNKVGKVTGNTATKMLGTKLAGRAAEASMNNALWAGSAVIGQGIETVYSLFDRRRTYKQISNDLAASGLPVQAIAQSGILKQAKEEVSGLRSWLGSGVKIAGMAGNVWLMMFSRMGGKFMPLVSFAGLGIATTGADALIRSGHTILPSYSALTKSLEQTGRASLELYMGIIGSLNPDVKVDALEKFAAQCAKEQVGGPELLRRIVVFKQEIKNAPAVPAAAPTQEAATKAGTREVVGAHTASLAQRSTRAASPAL